MKDIIKRQYKHKNGFTLVELLLVITIIGVLAAVAVPRFFGRSQEARIIAVRQTIVGTFGIALDLFEQDVGYYPTTEQGIDALLVGSNITNWHGPYLKAASIPMDPWNNPYRYQYPSQLTDLESLYDITSAGPDGAYGNSDDITNHDNAYENRDEK